MIQLIDQRALPTVMLDTENIPAPVVTAEFETEAEAFVALRDMNRDNWSGWLLYDTNDPVVSTSGDNIAAWLHRTGPWAGFPLP